MNSGKAIFSQIMQLIPRRELSEIVTRQKGSFRVRSLSSNDQFLVVCILAFKNVQEKNYNSKNLHFI